MMAPFFSFMVRTACVVLAGAIGIGPLIAQEAPDVSGEPLTKKEKEAVAAIQPPDLPKDAAPASNEGGPPSVAPPAPGEVDAVEMPEADIALPPGNRIPEEWVRSQGSPVVPSVPTGPSEVTKSTSTSGQFIVHGTALHIRNGVARRCEKIAEDLRQVLKDKTAWVLPIVIHLRGEEESPATGPTVSTQITEMAHGGFHLQLTVFARKDLKIRDLEKELFRVLLAERILRNQKAITSKRERLLPDWLYTGVVEAARYRERTRPSALFSILFESGKIYGIEEIIEASPMQMDSLSRAIYDTSCCALVLALLDQGEGATRFAQFLNSLANDSRSERELLDQWFPSVAASPTSLNKWWALQMATMAQPTVAEPLSPTESYEAIKSALILRYEAPLNKAPPSAQPDLTPPPTQLTPVTSPPPPQVVEVPVKKVEPAPKPKAQAKTESKSESLSTVAAASEESEEEEMAASEDEEATDDGKPNVFGKLFGFLKKKDSDEEASGEAMAEVAEATVPGPESAPAPAPEMESEPEPEPVVELKEEPKVELAKSEEPTVSEKETMDEELETEDKKGFNLLRWIRSKKSNAEEEAAEVKEPEEVPESSSTGEAGTESETASVSEALRWISPTSAWLLEASQDWIQPGETPRQVFLKFLRKKKKDGEDEDDAEGSEEAREEKETDSKSEKPKEEPSNKKEATTEKKDDAESPEVESSPPPAPKPTPKPAPPRKPVDLSKIVPIVQVRSPLSEYAYMMEREDRVEILNASQKSLQALESRVGVLFRSIILGYVAVIEQLKNGKTTGVDAQLKQLDSQLEAARLMSNKMRDYLDWYEASHSGAYSGLFDEYLNLSETIERETPARTDPISEYLDALEAEFSE